ncbi:MAG: sigma 54-interacting transcriptional regulator, partial [Lachnospiraceae bacterium]|nr:sigma 54-interacting transcriptional regulator [Lachnospiraceae bacterium]
MSDSYRPLESRLKSIRENLKEFAQMISKMVDSDVLIIDSNLDVVADALVYYELYTTVDMNSLVARIMREKQTVVVKERSKEASCLNCPVHDTCEIDSLLGVPILYAGRIIGAIALLLPKHRSTDLFTNLDLVVKFTENMAELITDRLKDRTAYNQVRLSEIEKDTILDTSGESIAETDPTGTILYTNLPFRRLFRLDNGLVGQSLQALLPHRYITGFFEGKSVLNNRVLTIRACGSEFNVIASAREIRSLTAPHKRYILTFRRSHEVWQAARKASFGSLMTMQWCEGWVFSPQTVDRAKSLAVSGKPVLIEGPEADLNDSAAKAICNYSDRSEQGIVSVNCNNVSHELFDRYVLGRYGQIARADNATIIFYNVERLPLYMQEILTDYLKRGTVYLGNERVQSDARVIFTTTADLEQEVAEGRFSEPLYYRIRPGRILVDSPLRDPARLEALLKSSFAHYKDVLKKPGVTLSKNAQHFLLGMQWQHVTDLERFIEHIVRSCDGCVHTAD